MMWYEIGQFRDSIKQMREFFAEMSARKDEIAIYGLRQIMHLSGFENIEGSLAEFPVKLMDVTETARFVDKTIFDRMNELVKESKIEDTLTHIRIQFDIAKRQRLISPLLRVLRSISFKIPFVRITIKDTLEFGNESISINKILIALSRLESLLASLHNLAYDRSKSDDEIFKPSNIDPTFVCEQIEAAISEIEKTDNIGKAEKIRLIIYLNDAKVELSKDPPSWKKVVGALVIISTILSGMANAPKAIDNVHSAIKHILGTSVERQIPNLLPPSRDSKDEIKTFPEVTDI